MNSRGLTLLEGLVLVVILATFAALLLPPCLPRRPARRASCLSNLHQLYVLGSLYARSHQGEWPKATGENLWLSFRKMTPPLIEADHAGILHCDVLDPELGTEETNYRGPRVPFKEVPANGPLAADAEGNHGEQFGGNVLFKDGSVSEFEREDPKWQAYAAKLSP